MAFKISQDILSQLRHWNNTLVSQHALQMVTIESRYVCVVPKRSYTALKPHIPQPVTNPSKGKKWFIRRSHLDRAKPVDHAVQPENAKANEDGETNKDIIPEPISTLGPPKHGEPIPQSLIKRQPVEYHAVEASKFDDNSIWYPTYKFPYISYCRAVIRFKLYLSLFSASACCYNIGKFLLHSRLDVLPSAFLVSVFSLTGLCVLGDYFRKIIVQVYTSEDLNYVRLCRFTFFGRRQDIVLPKTAIISLSESNLTKRQMFLKLCTTRPSEVDLKYDNYEFYDEIFKISVKWGGVLDRDRFQSALGRILDKKV